MRRKRSKREQEYIIESILEKRESKSEVIEEEEIGEEEIGDEEIGDEEIGEEERNA